VIVGIVAVGLEGEDVLQRGPVAEGEEGVWGKGGLGGNKTGRLQGSEESLWDPRKVVR